MSPIALGIVLYQGLPGARANFIAVTRRDREREKQVVSILSEPSPNLNTIRQLTSHSWPTPKNILFRVHRNTANLGLTRSDGAWNPRRTISFSAAAEPAPGKSLSFPLLTETASCPPRRSYFSKTLRCFCPMPFPPFSVVLILF